MILTINRTRWIKKGGTRGGGGKRGEALKKDASDCGKRVKWDISPAEKRRKGKWDPVGYKSH